MIIFGAPHDGHRVRASCWTSWGWLAGGRAAPARAGLGCFRDRFLAAPVGITQGAEPKGGGAMPMGKERTKEQLYSEAKRLDIKGRSKMNKGALKAALARRGH